MDTLETERLSVVLWELVITVPTTLRLGGGFGFGPTGNPSSSSFLICDREACRTPLLSPLGHGRKGTRTLAPLLCFGLLQRALPYMVSACRCHLVGVSVPRNYVCGNNGIPGAAHPSAERPGLRRAAGTQHTRTPNLQPLSCYLRALPDPDFGLEKRETLPGPRGALGAADGHTDSLLCPPSPLSGRGREWEAWSLEFWTHVHCVQWPPDFREGLSSFCCPPE